LPDAQARVGVNPRLRVGLTRREPPSPTPIDHVSALDELLACHGFCRYALTRTPVGHWQLVAELADQQLEVVLDTGAGNTVVDVETGGLEHNRKIRAAHGAEYGQA